MPLVRAVALEAVAGAGHQVVAAARGAFAKVGHADGRVRVGAEAAEDALGQVEPGDAPAVGVLDRRWRRWGIRPRRAGRPSSSPSQFPAGRARGLETSGGVGG